MFPMDLSITHITAGLFLTALVLLAVAAPTAIPASKVLRRVGLNPWLSLVYVLPLVGLIALWIFAGARWPKVDAPASSQRAPSRT
jgi:uncharacterized membrane protein YhaH (DUF805 family)